MNLVGAVDGKTGIQINTDHRTWLKVFVVGSKTSHDVELEYEKDSQFLIKPTIRLTIPELKGRQFVAFWWYAEDDVTPKQSLMTLKGVSYLPLRDLSCHRMMSATMNTLDAANIPVARLEVSHEHRPSEPALQLEAPQDEQLHAAAAVLEEYTNDVTTFLKQNYPARQQLQYRELGNVLPPVQDPHYKSAFPFDVEMPDWAFTLPALDTQVPAAATPYFLYLLRVAMIRLGLDRADDLNESELLELGCEMVTMPSLAMRYRADHQGKRSTDEWTYLSHFPSWKRASLDCEDAAEHTFRMAHFLCNLQLPESATPPPLQAALARVKQTMRNYHFFMCLGTLQLPGSHVWHAFVMGFESDWIRATLEGDTIPSYHPKTVLLESTCYLTSHMGFRPRHVDVPLQRRAENTYDFGTPEDFNQDEDEIKDSDDLCPVPLCRKLGVAKLAEQFHYKHLALALAPQFAFQTRHRSGFLTFQYLGGRQTLGVHMNSVLAPGPLRDQYVTVVPCVPSPTKLEEVIRRVQSFMPPPKFPEIENIDQKLLDLEKAVQNLPAKRQQTVYCTVGPATEEQLRETQAFLQDTVATRGSGTQIQRVSAEIGFGAFVHLFVLWSGAEALN